MANIFSTNVAPILFKRFIDDGFGILKGNNVDIMDLFIYKREDFNSSGKLDIRFPKGREQTWKIWRFTGIQLLKNKKHFFSGDYV